MTSKDSERTNALNTGIVRLTETANGFAHAHGEGGDSFKTFDAGLGKLPSIVPANFGEEQFGVAENTGQWIVEFVAQHFAEIFAIRDFRSGAREAGLERLSAEAPRGMQALFDTRGSSGKMRFVGGQEIGGTGGDQSGKTGGRFFVAENDNGSESGKRCHDVRERLPLGAVRVRIGRQRRFLQDDDVGRKVRDGVARGGKTGHRRDMAREFAAFKGDTHCRTKGCVVTDEKYGWFESLH